LKHLASAILSFALLAAPASAQVTATVTDTRTITQRDGGKPDTVLSHTISAGGRTRIEHRGSDPETAAGKLASAIQIISAGDSDLVMTYIDTTRKMYAEMRPMSMMSAAMGMTNMKMDDTLSRPTLDSIGPGPVINGHPTLHFRTKMTSRLSMVMMGDSSVMTQAITSDLFLAPDVKRVEPDSTGTKLSSRWEKMLPQGLMHLAGGAEAINARLAKYGMPLRTEMETVHTTAAGTMTVHQTVDILRRERVVVPNALFLPPPGYKKVGFMDMVQIP